jgi:glycerol-3-phosphate acyltransferase PlsY
MPLLMYFLWAPRHAPPLVITFGSLAAAVLIVCKHAGNIRRLVQGVEPKFSFGMTKDAE